MTGLVVAGVGSELRGDDGVGAAVVSALGALGTPALRVVVLSEPVELLELWDRATHTAVVVDATRGAGPPGAVTVTELSATSGDAARPDWASTHVVGLGAVVRLARALGRCPEQVLLVGVEGAGFGVGRGLSDAVADAVPLVVARVLELVAPCA